MSAFSETAKISAFARRDLRIMLSYRFAAAAELLGLAGQALAFSFLGKLVKGSSLPAYGATHATYLGFVTIGLALNMVVVLMLHQLASAIRTEQMVGTLESLLATPTRIGTIQAGSAAFQLLFVPFRMGIFVAIVGIVFGLHYQAAGIAPAIAVVAGLLPFLWGLGLLCAGAMLTFRRGGGALMTGSTILGLASGALFPLSLLPGFLQTIAHSNPLAITIAGVRQALIGGTGWGPVGGALVELIPVSAAAVALGAVAFRLALRRERRLGTLGLY